MQEWVTRACKLLQAIGEPPDPQVAFGCFVIALDAMLAYFNKRPHSKHPHAARPLYLHAEGQVSPRWFCLLACCLFVHVLICLCLQGLKECQVARGRQGVR